tara:strand:+ start:1479 stop:2186 length:708 start_codon:yes stop_codon:yes gene_type:complete
MRVSSQHKFIFLSNPKCGSSSIDLALEDYSTFGHEHCRPDDDYAPPENGFDDRAIRHINAHQLKIYFDQMKDTDDSDFDWEWDNYYKFTTIRNPWEKMVSYYFFSRPDKDNNFFLQKGKWDGDSMFHNGFNSWLKWVVSKHGLPSYEYFCLNHDTQEEMVDDVFDISEINGEMLNKLKELGLDIEDIPKRQPANLQDSASSVTDNYFSLYNSETRGIIETIYASDIEKFNYQFDQ